MPRQAYRGAIFHLLDDPATAGPAAAQFLEDGVLIVEDGHVAGIVPWDEEAISALGGAKIEHFPGGLIVPGFVDAHVHYPQVDIVASPGNRLLEWLSLYTFPAEARFHHKEVAEETAGFFLDRLLANGTTSALVFATAHKVSAEALFEAAQTRNMRLVTGKVLMDVGAPAGISDTAETGFMESKSLIRAWHGKGRLGYAVTPRFALTSSPRQLELAGKLIAEHPGVMLHTHLSENVEELAAVARAFPDCPDYFAVYEKFGLATRHSLFAHCLHLSEDEWGRMRQAGSAVAFCPVSNLFLGSGLFDMAHAHDVRLGLGSDVGAGTSLSMFAVMGDAYKVCQMTRHPLDALRLFYLATLGGARGMGIDGYVGNFTPGKEADFVVLKPDEPMLARRLAHARKLSEKLFALAILADDRAVTRTYVAGRLAWRRA
jgi:guanine deaminase